MSNELKHFQASVELALKNLQDLPQGFMRDQAFLKLSEAMHWARCAAEVTEVDNEAPETNTAE